MTIGKLLQVTAIQLHRNFPVLTFQMILVQVEQKLAESLGRSPGLVVMGGDSCSKGCEFESRHFTYTVWTFFHIHICYKNLWCV